MIPEEAKKIFVSKYSEFGDDKFYKFLLNYAINRIVLSEEVKKVDAEKSEEIKQITDITSPEIELIDFYDKFLVLYRRENNQIYLDIAKIFRKAAQKIYLMMYRKNIVKRSNRFLNLV